MQRKYFLTLILCISFVVAKSQNYPYPAVENGEPTEALHGIPGNLQYRTLIVSKTKQLELIRKIKNFLAGSQLLDTVKNKLNKITDKVSEFTVPLQFRSGFIAGKGKSFISKRLRNPLILSFDAIFKFSDSTITITFTHFKEDVFYEIRYSTEENSPPEIGFNYAVGDAKAAALIKLQDDIMQAGTTFGKIMTVYDAGGINASIKLSGKGVSVETDQAIKNKFAELNKSLDEQYKIINEAVGSNLGQWISNPTTALTYFNKVRPKFKKTYELAQSRIAEGYLLVADNDRWDNYFEKVLNDVILNIANLISGEIKNIQKNDIIKYTMIDGKLQLLKVAK